MSDGEKGDVLDNSRPDPGNNSQDKPQSYGTEIVLRGLNPTKPVSFGTVRVVGSETFSPEMEKANE